MTEFTVDQLRTLLPAGSIVLDASASDRDDAIRQVGRALVEAGAVADHYVDAMLERENSVSTYVGEGVAMPHGTLTAKDDVIDEALVLLRFAEPVEWNGDSVTVAIGISARGRGYIAMISQLAAVLLDPAKASALRDATSPDEVYAVFA